MLQVHEADETHRGTIESLRSRLQRLEADAARHQEALDSTSVSNKQQIDKLHQEKALLEVRWEGVLSRWSRS